MKKLTTIVLAALMACLVSCSEDELAILSYEFSDFEMIEATSAYDRYGNPVSSHWSTDQNNFLFNKDRGIEPADKIQLTSASDALFQYTSERIGSLSLKARYTTNDSTLVFRIEPLIDRADSSILIFEEGADFISSQAFGYQRRSIENDGREIIFAGAGYGELDVAILTQRMDERDTLYVQKFRSIYRPLE